MALKLAFPVASDRGLQSRVFTCFGSAPALLVVDAETGSYRAAPGPLPARGRGAAAPLAALHALSVDGVVLRAIEPRALWSLHAADVLVYVARHETVAEAVAAWRSGTLRLLTPGVDPWAGTAGASLANEAVAPECRAAARAASR
jgi:predicted Fe-Mo cluster-binding NifX family protein